MFSGSHCDVMPRRAVRELQHIGKFFPPQKIAITGYSIHKRVVRPVTAAEGMPKLPVFQKHLVYIVVTLNHSYSFLSYIPAGCGLRGIMESVCL